MFKRVQDIFFLPILILNINPLGANPTKWSNTLKQFVDNMPANCLSVFDQFVGLTLKGFNLYLKFDIPNHMIN